eukprot:CAMPEP_0172712078 /NCGR_PEP_ID=MMETSP1074-20121228/60889_1 /TAXON_ID=2916 /ORGANISM="Ceratium fusus, Strain PA161109" /LENGTH=269 /DNA_ID=CAMNT_0013535953 /DNA_START=119 /DNA_END=928 /DNA_ORIENTATION=+
MSAALPSTVPSEAVMPAQSSPCDNYAVKVGDKPNDQGGCSKVEDFRTSFLRRLSYSKVWVPMAKRPPRSQTVIIFDWDDTLLCTSQLSALAASGKALPLSFFNALRGVAKAAASLLAAAGRLGRTFIITNAVDGWVQYSAAKWVPELLPALQHIDVISARSRHEPFCPDVWQWKTRAFLDVQGQLDDEAVTNLVAVGDSDFEMDAVQVMGKKFTRSLVKTIRFQANPSPNELCKELQLFLKKLKKIIEAGRHLQIRMDRRPANLQASPG